MNTGSDNIVITTPYTFTATAEVIRYSGAHPVFVDIEKDSFNIDPVLIKKALQKYGEKCSAIIPVHIGGDPCKMVEINAYAAEYGVKVIEDAAHAFPIKTKNSWVGTIGDAGVFSFYATKTITTGEGGMLVTNDKKIAERVSIMRMHGIDREVWNRYFGKSKSSWQYDVIDAGYKYNLTDIAAAIGRVQLKKAAALLAKRKKIAEKYIASFSEYDFLEIPLLKPDHAWHLFILQINTELLTINRDEYIELLAAKGIGTSVHYIPLHILTYYKKLYNFHPEDFPVAFNKYKKVISIPIYPDLTDDQINRISKAVIETGRNHYKRAINGK